MGMTQDGEASRDGPRMTHQHLGLKGRRGIFQYFSVGWELVRLLSPKFNTGGESSPRFNPGILGMGGANP